MTEVPLFRAEAVRHHERERGGDMLRLSPAWISHSYRGLVLALGAAFVFSLVAELDEHARGPVVVRVTDGALVTAVAAGTVRVVQATPGSRTEAGDALVRFNDDEERADLVRLTHEFELQLAKLLVDPRDQTARAAVVGLRADRERALARIDARVVRAPRAGVVRDVRIRPGQRLEAGDAVLTVVGDDARFTLAAFLPGHARPLIAPGDKLVVELEGYREHRAAFVVESVGDELIGPTEVRRYLGPEIGDAVPVVGPVVIVTASIGAGTFLVDGRSIGYHDGMLGYADVATRRERLLFALVPGLRGLF